MDKAEQIAIQAKHLLANTKLSTMIDEFVKKICTPDIEKTERLIKYFLETLVKTGTIEKYYIEKFKDTEHELHIQYIEQNTLYLHTLSIIIPGDK